MESIEGMKGITSTFQFRAAPRLAVVPMNGRFQTLYNFRLTRTNNRFLGNNTRSPAVPAPQSYRNIPASLLSANHLPFGSVSPLHERQHLGPLHELEHLRLPAGRVEHNILGLPPQPFGVGLLDRGLERGCIDLDWPVALARRRHHL
jgi:hypothetical protein